MTATAGFLEKGHISSAASLVHEVCSGWKESEIGQRSRKRPNSELKRQPLISNVETVAVCSTPKYAGQAAFQQMPGANTGMGMDLGTQQALPAPEGKIIPALHGKQDLSLVNLPLVFPLESLIQNSPTCHKMPGQEPSRTYIPFRLLRVAVPVLCNPLL